MNAYVVVEEPLAVPILHAVLPPELLRDVWLEPSGELSNIVSVARTLLSSRRKPVAVLIPTYSVHESVIQEKRQISEELIRMAAAGTPYCLLLLVPEVEVVFFQAPGLIEKAFGKRAANEVRALARLGPKEALAHLFALPNGPRDFQTFLDALDDEDVEAVRSTGPIRELTAFLTEAAVLA